MEAGSGLPGSAGDDFNANLTSLSVDVGTLRFYDRQLHMLYVKALVPFTVAAVIFFVIVAVCVYRRHKERLCKYV